MLFSPLRKETLPEIAMHFSGTSISTDSLKIDGKHTASMESERSDTQEYHTFIIFGYHLPSIFYNSGNGYRRIVAKLIVFVLFYFFNIYISAFQFQTNAVQRVTGNV